MKFAFYASTKKRTHVLGRMLRAGAEVHGDEVVLVSQENANEVLDVDGGAILGMNQTAKRLLPMYRAAGKHMLLFDKGYIHRDLYLRMSVDAWQPLAYFQRFMRSDDRLQRMQTLGFRICERRLSEPNYPIVIAGTCQSHNNFHGLGDVTEYYSEVVRRIREYTDRRIVYRPNPAWALRHTDQFKPIPGTKLSPPTEPFPEVLKNAHLVVTHGSSAAFQAFARGVPVMVLGEGIAAPVSIGDDYSKVETPFWPRPRDRWQYFCDVAYCQWTLAELREGLAWKELKLIIASLEKSPCAYTAEELLEQYRIMHTSSRYFRGLSVLRHADTIDRAIRKQGAKTILDYGSGKGMQYEHPYLVGRRWKVEVTCYDPAVPGIDTLPPKEAVFDGVICTDVLEHIPEHDIQDTLRRIFGYANKFVFLSIATAPAKKELPDGQNCHATVRPQEWWMQQLGEAVDATGSVDKRLIAKFEGEDDD